MQSDRVNAAVAAVAVAAAAAAVDVVTAKFEMPTADRTVGGDR